tara:strand:+ start:997 stop:2205 length:1209 start_codon:yes stop_codon:yes gene_type:complete
MIPLEEAQSHVLRNVSQLPSGGLALSSACSHVTAQAVTSKELVPPFDNTAVDGYAVIAFNTLDASDSDEVQLEVIGSIAAGVDPDFELEDGQCAKIMTGAPMPKGADAVVMVEWTSTNDVGDAVRISKSVKEGDHIRRSGEDLQVGDQVVGEGTFLTPAHIGLLAGIGVYQVNVVQRPVVGVFSTGDELVEGNKPLKPGQIRDSNRFSLLALLERDGFQTVDLGLIPDDKEAIESTVLEGVEKCDALLTTGGVSMGDYDYVKVVLDEIGDMRWMQIAIKPAKPFAFGVVQSVPVFGLPGNPVSSMVSYLLLAKPALQKMMGLDSVLPSYFLGEAGEDFHRRVDGKTHFVRSFLERSKDKNLIHPVGKQGSHQLSGMAEADTLAVIHDGEGISKGSSIEYFRY